MKNTLVIAMVLLVTVLLSGCKKEPIDRKIEGMWKLEQFTTHEDGVVHGDCRRIFYSIQLWVVELAEKQCTHGYGTYIGRFDYNDDHSTVTMKDFKYRQSTGDSNENVPVEKLLPYGINSLNTTFEVVKADGKHLTLKSDYATLEFTSF